MKPYIKLTAPRRFFVPTVRWYFGKSILVNPGKELLIEKETYKSMNLNYEANGFGVNVEEVQTDDFYMFSGTAFKELEAEHAKRAIAQPGPYSVKQYLPDYTNRFSLDQGFEAGAVIDVIGTPGTVQGLTLNNGDKLRALVYGARKDHARDWELIRGKNAGGGTGGEIELPGGKTVDDLVFKGEIVNGIPVDLDLNDDGKIDEQFLPDTKAEGWGAEEW